MDDPATLTDEQLRDVIATATREQQRRSTLSSARTQVWQQLRDYEAAGGDPRELIADVATEWPTDGSAS